MDGPARSLQAHQLRWIGAFDAYAARYPEEAGVVALFCDFVARHSDAARRELVVGHLTGSAWVVSADGRRVLLTHHRKLNRWLQPGGHADGDENILQVALREAEEETGLTDFENVTDGIF